MEGFLVDFYPEVRGDRPNFLSALIHALEVHERTMAFVHCSIRKVRSLKMPVDVGGKDKMRQFMFAYPFQE